MPRTKSWGFDPANIDRSVRPQDDFYQYANGSWLRTTTIPPTESRWGAFNTLRHKTDTQLKQLLSDLVEERHVPHGSPEQLIRDFYRSGMDSATRGSRGVTPLEDMRSTVRTMRSNADLESVLALLHRCGVTAVWRSGIDQDMKDADRWQFVVLQGGLGMPDREYYLSKGAEQQRVRDAYLVHVEKLLRIAGYPASEAREAVRAILAIETRLARASMKKEELRDPDKLYNRHTLTRLTRLTPSLDWHGYLKGIGARNLKDVNVMQPAFFVEVDRMVDEVPLSDWKYYLDFHIINEFSGALSPKFVAQNFAFYGKALSGLTKPRPTWRLVLSVISADLGEPLSKLYVEEHFSESAKEKVEQLVDDLKSAYRARIAELSWMTPATKKRALKKLAAMKPKLGYPDKWRSFKGLEITPKDYVANICAAREYEHQDSMKKLAKGKVDRSEWYTHAHVVNAFYSPSHNDITFPAGILQAPFFSEDADDAVNYGGIGFVIGHELTHGFDNQGAKFDEVGNFKNWWKEADKKAFALRTKVVERQFSRYSVEGLKVNGTLTLGENIADLGGIALAYDAYQLSLARTGRKDLDGFSPEERFFLGAAQIWQMVCRPEFRKLQILTDPHSPEMLRINGPFSNFDPFYETYGVQKGDALYRAPSTRARVW